MSKQREIIFEVLKSVKSHPTAEEVYEMSRKSLPGIGLATVYRNLGYLAKIGKIQIVMNHGGQMGFDGNPDLHHHVTCTICGRVDDIAFAEPIDIKLSTNNDAGYEITSSKIELYGICPKCKKS